MIHKILRLFVNTLTVDERHYLLNRDKLILSIYQKKMTVIADVFAEIPATKNMVRYMSKKQCFRGPLDREYGKSVETIFQSE